MSNVLTNNKVVCYKLKRVPDVGRKVPTLTKPIWDC